MPKSRKSNVRTPAPVLHIFCEGEKTEPNYLKGYLERYHPGTRRLKVIKIEKTRKNTPRQLIDEAITLKNRKDTLDSDEFWVVYDRESIAKYSHALHKSCIQRAASKHIEVALSNVCFEFFFLCHLIEFPSAAYSDYKDLIGNSDLKARLNELGVPNYDKADATLFEKVGHLVDIARKRAIRVNNAIIAASQYDESDPHRLNPYTAIPKLLDAIDDFINKPQNI